MNTILRGVEIDKHINAAISRRLRESWFTINPLSMSKDRKTVGLNPSVPGTTPGSVGCGESKEFGMKGMKWGRHKSEQEMAGSVAAGGGSYKGIQDGGKYAEDMAMFDDPKTRTTLVLPISQTDANAVKDKIATSRKKFGFKEALRNWKKAILGHHQAIMVDPRVREHGVKGMKWGERKAKILKKIGHIDGLLALGKEGPFKTLEDERKVNKALDALWDQYTKLATQKNREHGGDGSLNQILRQRK